MFRADQLGTDLEALKLELNIAGFGGFPIAEGIAPLPKAAAQREYDQDMGTGNFKRTVVPAERSNSMEPLIC